MEIKQNNIYKILNYSKTLERSLYLIGIYKKEIRKKSKIEKKSTESKKARIKIIKRSNVKKTKWSDLKEKAYK